jgi:hypothetical protein
MMRKLLVKEEVGAAAVLALSGAVVVLICRGDGPLSAGRFVSGVLSNPIPKGASGVLRPPVPAPRQRTAA